MYARINTEAITLRIPAIASGFQLTDLIRRPPVLQRIAVAISKQERLFSVCVVHEGFVRLFNAVLGRGD